MGKEICVNFPLAAAISLRNLALAITAAEELNHFGFHISASNIEAGNPFNTDGLRDFR